MLLRMTYGVAGLSVCPGVIYSRYAMNVIRNGLVDTTYSIPKYNATTYGPACFCFPEATSAEAYPANSTGAVGWMKTEPSRRCPVIGGVVKSSFN